MKKETKAMTLRLPADQAAELEKVAAIDGVPISSLARDALLRHVEERRRDPEFRKRLERYLVEDKAILDRLAQ